MLVRPHHRPSQSRKLQRLFALTKSHAAVRHREVASTTSAAVNLPQGTATQPRTVLKIPCRQKASESVRFNAPFSQSFNSDRIQSKVVVAVEVVEVEAVAVVAGLSIDKARPERRASQSISCLIQLLISFQQ